jgi:hypothetical protein
LKDFCTPSRPDARILEQCRIAVDSALSIVKRQAS